MAVEGNRLYDVSYAIQNYVESNGYSVVRALVGHGIGKKMHEEPQVPNYGIPGKGPRLVAGLTLAVEPMVNEGDFHVKTLSDGWTVVTSDGSLSAHYENTIVITDGEPEIFTMV
jgi:methionyl aminopeptidase